VLEDSEFLGELENGCRRFDLSHVRHAEEQKVEPPRRYYYIAVRNYEAAEKLFTAIKRRALDAELASEICKPHETTIFDDEDRKWRTLEAWRGAEDKSWVCTEYPPFGYVPVLGWVDVSSFETYKKAKEEAERLWNLAEDILGQHIDIGQCIPGRGSCRRYAFRLASFL
jgi:hypothetical protein